MQARRAYTACKMAHQYTLRSIPPVIDAALRRLAEREHKSLNTVALEALTRGLELAAAPAKFDDLDHLVGSWQDDSEFERVMADFGRVDEEAWK